ncbi:pepsin-like aspartic protease [Aspergillus saccharolyticus JOP 1030-1]|uniref:Probable aspartic-type endopeptidase OPSB n=1 Tax=Aspergillus saccharolyticus JOP 1030-1 TaxID=1450539 RepID=A0A318Z9R1_9EURO|nr:aspartic protease [Aspergillus saccharolyticus JOP 1030-1]PYH44096.1 aspartic protease [Aspergillus saccharolyticus JOP 1030-1]
MKNLALLLPLLGLIQPLSALTLHESSQPATLQYTVERRHNTIRASHKRAATVESDIGNKVGAEVDYVINLSLGTPGQNVSVIIDTGSSDLWVNAANGSDPNANSTYGTYDASSSSTYKYINDEFIIQYVDGSEAAGDYVNDTLKVGNATLTNFQFGVASNSTSSQGVLGIGYTLGETSSQFGGGEYPNLPKALVNQGYIKSAAYSLWLDDVDAKEGTILFGGVNTAKYTGSLHTLAIEKVNGVYSTLVVSLAGVHVTGTDSSSINNTAFPVLGVLDSGTSLTYLPATPALELIEAVGAEYIERAGYAIVDCDVADKDYEIVFEFSGFNLSVSVGDLLLDEGSYCVFGIVPQDDEDDGEYVLGDTFLRSAYVVYDLENNEVAIAKTNTDPGTDHILEIGSGSSGIPNATGVSSSSSSDGSSKESAAVVLRLDVSLLCAAIIGSLLLIS